MRAVLLAVPLIATAFIAHAADLKSSIDANNQKFLAAYGKGDAAALAAMYTAGATLLPPGAALAKGHDAIQAFWQGAMKSGFKLTSLQAVSIEQYGNAAREIGRATGEGPDKMEFKYVVVWKAVHGQWKLDTDIWNANK
jgi:ketosteroid isomerase-like protein